MTAEVKFTPASVAILGAFTLLCAVLLLAAGIGGSYWVNHETQVKQVRQGLVIEARLCHTLNALAGLQPPAGSAATNPSRAYEQAQHQILASLSPDIGCKG